jgi:hypothetical protein
MYFYGTGPECAQNGVREVWVQYSTTGIRSQTSGYIREFSGHCRALRGNPSTHLVDFSERL